MRGKDGDVEIAGSTGWMKHEKSGWPLPYTAGFQRGWQCGVTEALRTNLGKNGYKQHLRSRYRTNLWGDVSAEQLSHLFHVDSVTQRNSQEHYIDSVLTAFWGKEELNALSVYLLLDEAVTREWISRDELNEIAVRWAELRHLMKTPQE